jgi:hypothetical protein
VVPRFCALTARNPNCETDLRLGLSLSPAYRASSRVGVTTGWQGKGRSQGKVPAFAPVREAKTTRPTARISAKTYLKDQVAGAQHRPRKAGGVRAGLRFRSTPFRRRRSFAVNNQLSPIRRAGMYLRVSAKGQETDNHFFRCSTLSKHSNGSGMISLIT